MYRGESVKSVFKTTIKDSTHFIDVRNRNKGYVLFNPPYSQNAKCKNKYGQTFHQ